VQIDHEGSQEQNPEKIVAALAVAVTLGGDCLADIAMLRAQPELAGRVASDPVVSPVAGRRGSDKSPYRSPLQHTEPPAEQALQSREGTAFGLELILLSVKCAAASCPILGARWERQAARRCAEMRRPWPFLDA
jgi:hypothetical protein